MTTTDIVVIIAVAAAGAQLLEARALAGAGSARS